MQQIYLRIALPTPLRRLFDYLPPQGVDPKAFIPGVRIRVPFQSRTLIGLLTEVVDKTSVPYGKLKEATEVLDKSPLLPKDVDQLCQWAADYYHYSLGEVLSAAMPTLLRKGKETTTTAKNIPATTHVAETQPTLNEAQASAVKTICDAKKIFQVFLLDGVTGSGKTEVYLRVIEEIIKDNKQVLVLVPEISLTPQTIERFRTRFAVPVAALHSSLSDKERLQAWLSARSGDAKIVIGTRSAIFTPFANLGLIIVDEEHDTSFKQQDRFRYHARDLAIMRANTNQIPIVLGSATPSLESLLNVKRHRYTYLSLPNRAGAAVMPTYQMIDLSRTSIEEGLSPPLVAAMHQHLAENNQVMLFLNRRGFAPVLFCSQCNWIADCKRCDTRMVYHKKPLRLHCHHCDSRMHIPKSCAKCQSENLHPVGLGTQRLEQTLEQQFKDIPIIRIDRDSTRRKDSMQELLNQIHAQPKAILLGTQMLAKGHHFPNVTLVGIIDADSGLFSADFRAAEQTGQLLVQVAGRAGRADKPGTVAIQSRFPDHPLLQTLTREGYPPFAQSLLNERELAVLPPFSYFAVVRAESYTEESAAAFLAAIKQLSVSLTDPVTILGPVPALLAKRKGLYCQHLIIKANRRSALQHFLKGILHQIEKIASDYPVKWVLDVDPIGVV